MKVGLVRHFEVLQRYTSHQWMSSAEYQAWVNAYDTSEIRIGRVDLGATEWGVCYCSDLPRAHKTAQAIYAGPLVATPLLREIPIGPVFHSARRWPFAFWEVVGRLAWYRGHSSQVEGRAQTLARVRAVLAQALARPEVNALIVSHGGLMWCLQPELERQGFKGEPFSKAENGRLYVYERS